jgi:hypothetical protein
MRTRCNGLLVGLLLATAPIMAFAADPAPAPAPPPPDMNDPGQPSAPIAKDDPRLKPLPAESAQTPAPPAGENAPVGPPKTDGDPTYAPRLPTDDAFHPPEKKPDANASADGFSVRTYTTSNGDKIEEYRHGGQLTKVRVQPANGFPYELRKSEDNARADRTDSRDKKTEPVRFTLFEWH